MTCPSRFLNGRIVAKEFIRHASAKRSMTRAYSRGLQTQAQDPYSVASQFSNEQREQFFQAASSSESLRNTIGYSLSFASSNSDTLSDDLRSDIFVNMPDKRMQEQLAISQDQLRQTSNTAAWDSAPLPRTLDDALSRSNQNRAIVITEASLPFKIVDVNTAWEGLCGFSFVECQGKTLGSLLGGPETDKSAVTAVVSQLLRGEEAGAVLTNYTKDGRKFQNHLRVAPLMNGDVVTHFVGVLQEIQDDAKISMQN
jgi:PAS domain S-box-containing protein